MILWALNAVKLLKMTLFLSRGLKLVVSQPLGQVCPFTYKLHQIDKNSNSSYKHNLKKKCFTEQINYNYFIIK